MFDQFVLQNPDGWEGSGADSASQVAMLNKALEAQDGITDIADLTSVGALQPQSLETMLALLTYQEKHLTLWKDVPKGNAVSTLEEYTVQTSYGPEGSFVDQMETPIEGDPTAQRQFATVRYLRTLYKFSDVAGIVKTIQDAEVWAKQSATMRLLQRMNSALYAGDSSMIPQAVDGFEKTIRNNGSTLHVIDCRGNAPTQTNFDNLAELLMQNFGDPDGANLYCSPGGLNTLAQILKNSSSIATNSVQRIIQGTVDQTGGISIGFGVRKIHTPFGTMTPKSDIFIGREYESKTVPQIQNPASPTILIEGNTSIRSPAAPSHAVAINAPTVAGSKWLASGESRVAGTFKFRVAAGNRYGLSVADAADAGSAVAAAGSLTVTITPSSSSLYPATYFEVYGEAYAGAVAAGGKFLYMGRVAANGLTPVTFVDKNQSIPGTTKMFLLDLTSVGERRTFMLKRLAPLHAKPYARIGEYGWGSVNLYVAPTFYAPLRFAMLDNVLVGQQATNSLLAI